MKRKILEFICFRGALFHRETNTKQGELSVDMTYVSRKIRFLSFLAAIGVVVLHTNPIGYVENAPGWVSGFADVLSYFNSWAVPFFFMVSGFWFDRRADMIINWRVFWKKKVKTLVVPYVLWSIYGTVLWTGLRVVNNLRNGGASFGDTVFESGNWIAILDRIFGVFQCSPGNPTLWFVRLLILIFLTAPIWLWLRRKVFCLFVVIMMVLTILFSSVSWVSPCEHLFVLGGYSFEFKVQGLGWFGLGMVASALHLDARRIPFWLAAVFAAVWAVSVSLGYPVSSWALLSLVVFIWCCSDFVLNHLPAQLPAWMGLSFWIYCAHGPLSGCVGALYRALIGGSTVGAYILSVATMWAVTVGLSMALASVTRRFLPRVFVVLCGGRC